MPNFPRVIVFLVIFEMAAKTAKGTDNKLKAVRKKRLRFRICKCLFSNSSPLLFSQCISNDDCRGNSYCKEKEGHTYCTRCIRCEDFYFRAAPPRVECPESPLECGECLAGYAEDALTAGRKSIRSEEK